MEAEKFKAAIVDPPGRIIHCEDNGLNLCAQPIQQPQMVNNPVLCNLGLDDTQLCNTQGLIDIAKGVSDDDFLHLTCHIEPSLIHKIEKGEFVELEKLLPKDKEAVSETRMKVG